MTPNSEDAGPVIDQIRKTAPAERVIKAALLTLNLPICGSYPVKEARSILGIGHHTFQRLIRQFELDENGKLARPDCIRTLVLGTHRRVPFLELVEFVMRNDGYLRDNSQDKASHVGGD